MRCNFSSRAIDALAKRVGYRCSNPSCRKKTIGPGADDTRAVSISTAAHITAASGLGPRYDPSILPSQRSHISNGNWLCADCGRMIDSDPNRFSVELLRRWKRLAEVWPRRRTYEAAFAIWGSSGAITRGPSTVNFTTIEAPAMMTSKTKSEKRSRRSHVTTRVGEGPHRCGPEVRVTGSVSWARYRCAFAFLATPAQAGTRADCSTQTRS